MRITGAWKLSGISIKCLSIAVVAIMCATAFFVASASSEKVTYPDNPTMTGSTIAYASGPVAAMEFQPPTDGIWWFSAANSGLKRVHTLLLDVSSGPPTPVHSETIRFESNKDVTKNSTLMQVFGGRTYALNAQGIGRLPSSALLTGWFKSTYNLGPVAIMSAPREAHVGEPVQFNGNASYDIDGEIVSWSWLFGDDRVGDGPTLTHNYLTTGDYLVRLIVTDDDGATGNTSRIITILPPVVTESEWSEPAQIGVPSNQSSSGLSIAMNSKGQAAIAWCSYQTPDWRVWARRYMPDSGWQSPEQVGICDIAGQPQAGIDDAGNVTVAWTKSDVVFTRRNVIAYGAWDDPVALTSGTGHPTMMTLAVGPDGKAVLAWLEQVAGHYGVFASVRTVGNMWSAPVLIENSPDIADSPSAAIDHFGTAIVVFDIYVVQPTPQWDVWANTYVPGQGWQGAKLVENMAQFSYLPIVSMDVSGTAFATWCYSTSRSGPTGDTVYASRYVSGAWQPAVRLDPGTSPSSMLPRVSAWGPANATFIWLAQDDLMGLPGGIRASRYMAGVGWTAPEEMNTGARIWNPRVATDVTGNAFIGWFQQNSSSGYDVVAAMYSPGGAWTEPQTIGHVGSPKSLAVAAGPEDDAIIAWTDYGLGTVWACDHNAPADLPIAEAGPIQYVPVPFPVNVTLDGSGSYAPSGIVSYVWTWVGGMDNSPMMVTGVSPSVPWQWFFYIENYTVTLTITDAEGSTATDTTNVYMAFRLLREDNAFGVQQWYADTSGYLKVMIDNHGMNLVNWSVMDLTTTMDIVYRSTMYFSGDGVYVSEPYWMTAGQHIQITYELDGGPPGSYIFVYGFFVPVP